MEYRIKYSKEAIAELNEAFVWYRSKELSLGQRFSDTFNKIRIELKENPKIFREVDTNHRRAVLGSSFPYTIHYLLDEKTKTVKIIGVLHQSKNLELVEQRVKLEKVVEGRQKENLKVEQRMKALESLRQTKELEKGKERDRGLEL